MTRMKLRDDDNGRQRKNTLEEAFGPYTSTTLHPMPDDRPRQPLSRRLAEWSLYIVAVLAIVVVVVFR